MQEENNNNKASFGKGLSSFGIFVGVIGIIAGIVIFIFTRNSYTESVVPYLIWGFCLLLCFVSAGLGKIIELLEEIKNR